MKLSKDFDSIEFQCDCCGAMNISPELIRLLQLMRDSFGKPLSVTSGTRCQKHNKKVGGSIASDHLVGKAADIACYDSMTRRELVHIALSVGVPTIGVKRDCIHLSIGEPERLFTYD